MLFTSFYVKKLYDDAIIPTRGSKAAAGYDLYAHLDKDRILILPHCTVKIGTGIATSLPLGTFGAIFARSGLATKCGLRPANAVGVIDEDYRGEIIVALHNDTDFEQTVTNGDRIAQLVILPCYTPDIEIVDQLDDTERGDGGFGSTDIAYAIGTDNDGEQLSFFDTISYTYGETTSDGLT